MRIAIRNTFLLAILLSANSFAFSQTRYEEHELMVKLKIEDTYAPLVANNVLHEPYYITRLKKLGATKIEKPFAAVEELAYILRVTFHDSVNIHKDVLPILKYDHNFSYAEKVPIFSTIQASSFVPPSSQWYFNNINMNQSWNYIGVGEKIKVAVIDNAIRISHEEIRDNLFKNMAEIEGVDGEDDDHNGFVDDMYGWDFGDGDNNPAPPFNATTTYFSHGTHVTGVLCASSNNNVGIGAVGVNVELIPIKVTQDAPPNKNDRDLKYPWSGVSYAIAMGAQIINCSWGTVLDEPCKSCEDIIEVARAKNIVIVAASGNYGEEQALYPAAYQYVLAVGSTNKDDVKSSFSNYGGYVDVMAPGESIYSTLGNADNSYGYKDGTSMACPIVSGLASLLLSQYPDLDANTVVDLIKRGCDNIYPKNPTYEGKLGNGRINVDHTMTLAQDIGPASAYRASQDNFAVYPNPSNGEFFIRNLKAIPAQNGVAEIYDLQGRLLNVTALQNETVALTAPAAGTYMLTIKADGEVMHRQKLVILN